MERADAEDLCQKAPMRISPLAAALTGAIIVAGVASFAGNIQGKLAARAEFSRDIADARQVVLALRLYEVEEPLTRIASLDDLVRSGLLSDDKLLYRTLPDGTKQPRWFYFGFRGDQEGGEPVIASTRSHHGKWIIGTSDTCIELARDDFWQVP
jgi:hypothetical protein